jgi:alkylation response protein AidB-like acyl-CoA dehydrogenase
VIVRTDSRPASSREAFSRVELARASYDSRGIFAEGRRKELEALRQMGARDPSLGRLYEGHFNAVLLVALYGTDAQQRASSRDARAGCLFGVWNTQANEPVRVSRKGRRYVLNGAKTWCSGADSVSRALITAQTADGAIQMCLVPMDRVSATIDDSAWHPLGMEASNSFRVDFGAVELDEDDLIGSPGDYERSPWFLGGALRFAAVHAGIVERLAAETYAFLIATGRKDDAMQLARAGELRIAASGARNWIDAGEAAWLAFDSDPSEANAAAVVAQADMARLAIERAGLDALELAVRSVGARGLLEPLPFAGLVRDLTMYLRQPAPDTTLLRVGAGALASVPGAV